MLRRLALAAAALALGAALAGAQDDDLGCERAIQLHGFALETLGKCQDPATQNTPLCGLVGEFYESGAAANTSAANTGGGAEDASGTDQLQLVTNPEWAGSNWQDFLVQSTMTQMADLGEVSYVLSQVNASYQSLSPNTSSEDFFAAWAAPWWAQADVNIALASSDAVDPLGRSQTFWKAANYLFTGLWPFPFSTEALSRAADMVAAFESGMAAHPTYTGVTFEVTFNNGSAEAQLPGLLVTPDASKPLPLYIVTGGTDYPKEINVLQFGLPVLERGYALLVYDGPGQGEVIRSEPFMPFYPQWGEVLSEVLTYVESNLTEYVDTNAIVQAGVSLGGYLSSVACADPANAARLTACNPNPPIAAVAPTYKRFSDGIADGIYAPFQYVAQQDPSLLPPGFADAFADYYPIIDTLLLGCDADSEAPQLIADVFTSGPASIIDPELVYLAGGYGGAVTGDIDTLYSAMWQGFRNSQQFGAFDISGITVPVVGIKGTQDDLLGGQEEDFFAALSPDVANASVLITFDAASGGALHDQVGSPYGLAAQLFKALQPFLSA